LDMLRSSSDPAAELQPLVAEATSSARPRLTEQDLYEEYKRRKRDKVRDRMESVFWLIAGAIVMYATDFIRVLCVDSRINRLALNLGLVGMVIGASFVLSVPHSECRHWYLLLHDCLPAVAPD